MACLLIPFSNIGTHTNLRCYTAKYNYKFLHTSRIRNRFYDYEWMESKYSHFLLNSATLREIILDVGEFPL
jgi:hypothetical protein